MSLGGSTKNRTPHSTGTVAVTSYTSFLVPMPLMIRNESIHNPAMLLKKLYSIVPLLGEKYEMLCGLSNL